MIGDSMKDGTDILDIYKLSFEISDIPQCIIDCDGLIINQNEASRLQLGTGNHKRFSPASVSPDYQPDGRLSREKALEMIAIAFKEGQHSFDWVHKNDLHGDFLTRVNLDRIYYGEDIYLLVTIHDLSEIQKIERIVHDKTQALEESNAALRASQNEFKQIFENNLVGNMVISEDRIIKMCNQRFAEILGYEIHELIDQKTDLFYLSEKDYLGFGRRVKSELVNKGYIREEIALKKKDGSEVWCSMAGKLLETSFSDDKHILWVAQDITDQRQMRKELETLYLLARDANPITGLPGNLMITDAIKEVIEMNRDVCVIYCDLDNFKAYNDKYGFIRGDDVISFTANVFRSVEELCHPDKFFLGHIGGDDFVMIIPWHKISQVEKKIVYSFDTGIVNFYNEEDVTSGQILSVSRSGQKTKYPIMGLSMAGVKIKDVGYSSHLEVVDICTATKNRAKQLVNSCLVIDERRGSCRESQ